MSARFLKITLVTVTKRFVAVNTSALVLCIDKTCIRDVFLTTRLIRTVRHPDNTAGHSGVSPWSPV